MSKLANSSWHNSFFFFFIYFLFDSRVTLFRFVSRYSAIKALNKINKYSRSLNILVRGFSYDGNYNSH